MKVYSFLYHSFVTIKHIKHRYNSFYVNLFLLSCCDFRVKSTVLYYLSVSNVVLKRFMQKQILLITNLLKTQTEHVQQNDTFQITK